MRISEAVRIESFSGLFAAETAREILSGVPATASAVRVLTAGGEGQGLAAFVNAALERWPADGLDISVWALTDVAALRAWVQRFGLGHVGVIQDSFVATRHNGRRHREVVELVGAEQIRLGCTHCKVVHLVGTDVVISCSGNIESTPNKRIENLSIDVDPAWASEVRRWFDVAFEHVEAGIEARPLWDRGMRFAFSSCAAARAGEVAGASIPGFGAPAFSQPSTDAGLASAASSADGVSMRSTLESIHGQIDARLRGVVADGDLVNLGRAASTVFDRLGEIRGADLCLAGRICDVLEAAIVPRSRRERQELARRMMTEIRAEFEPQAKGD